MEVDVLEDGQLLFYGGSWLNYSGGSSVNYHLVFYTVSRCPPSRGLRQSISACGGADMSFQLRQE